MPDRDQTTVLMPLSDANDLDAVVHALGIEDSDTTPAEAVEELKAEIERLRALVQSEKCIQTSDGADLPGWQPMATAPWLKLSPREVEMVLWQIISDLGGEVTLTEADDKPGRSVMFTDYDGELIAIANEEAEA